ncbi:unnamed protein product [Durusdinium trenchii]|uniref:Uncharacterized protein n=1 Tax=Durusdinium trenchii TaxID=1381693 RepID=A0ABP0MM16_9DINO
MDDLEHVERDLEQDLKLNDYKEEIQKRAKKLYVYLVSFVRGKEAWNRLGIGGLSAIREGQDFEFEKGKILEGIMKYEKLVGEYERLAGSSLDENLKIITVMRCYPGQLRQHTYSKSTP